MKSRARVILVVLLLLVVAALFGRAWWSRPHVAKGSYVLLDLGGSYAEAPPRNLVARVLQGREQTLLDVLTLLRRATRDDRIEGVVVHLRNLEVGWGKAQDIRDALLRFRQSGKRLVAYVELEIASGNLEYYVASAADEVYLPPDATGPLNGLRSQFFFLGGVWEKLDIEMQVEKIREYKTAGDMLVNKSMTPAHREMANSLLDSINTQFVTEIARARGLQAEQVQAAIDSCPIDPAAFAATGLSNGVKFLDDIREGLLGPDGEFLEADDYQRAGGSLLAFGLGPKLAVVYGVGPIRTGGGSGISGQGIASDDLIDALEEAADDDSTAAIVFRIDSGGGSALASDLIWRATQKARRKKPLIVSMSDVAGSGGYYIAAGADRIVAQAGTLTGSIGVVVAKPNVSGLLAKLGITTETLTRGKYARLEDVTSSLTADERSKLVGAMNHIYETFVVRVAEGRHLSAEQVREVARGRVWTGEQAKEIGLVDDLGGFLRAIELAKQAAGLPIDEEVGLEFYPRTQGVLGQLARYVEMRNHLVTLPPAWEEIGKAMAAWSFADGTILTLMAEAIRVE